VNDSPFFKQADLMLRVLPHVAPEKDLVLKGGTAINFFVRDLPRLSVDIDLTYLPLESRETSLEKIGASLKRIGESVKRAIPGVQVRPSYVGKDQRISKLFIREREWQIKIEPNEVLRGALHPAEVRNLCKQAEKSFERSLSIRTLSIADLYGGKLCAALDRQHPRDFFDVKILLEAEGITEAIRKAFIVYLASSDRPMHELIDPIYKNFRQLFETEFLGMALVPVRYEELKDVRERLISKIKKELTPQERKFLLSLKEGKPEWSLLGLEGVEKLPAIQWKLANIQKMNTRKHAEMLAKLRKVLDL
jgi:predicted nucleotidyltransferase component of viral defense system